jgi:hypothetical protein
MRLSFLRIALTGVLLGAGLSGCIVAPVPASGDVVAYEAPPAPQYEVVGVAPAPGYFWIGGAWFWEGGRYAWHPGHWEAPRAGYRWVPHTWTRGGRGWHMHPGHWERRDYRR